MDKFQTERSKASSSSTQSESNNTERYHYYNGIDKIDRPPKHAFAVSSEVNSRRGLSGHGYEKYCVCTTMTT